METREKIAVPVLVILGIVAAALLGLVIWLLCRTEPEPTLHTDDGYVASPTEDAVLYDADGQELSRLTRGSAVTYVVETPQKAGWVRIVRTGGTFAYLKEENLTDDIEQVVTTAAVYPLHTVTLLDKDNAAGAPAEKGEALTVIGYDKLYSDGSIRRYEVRGKNGEGYVSAAQVSTDSSIPGYDEALYSLHYARGDRWSGGDAAKLDYFAHEKSDFSEQGNTMPEEVRALYLNSESIAQVDDYLELAKDSGVNAFVVDIVDGEDVAYPANAMQHYCPSAYAAAKNTAADYHDAVMKLRSAGYYVIGRITAFNDPYLAQDHPEYVIADRRSGAPLEMNGMYWPSPFIREVWCYKVALAVEAVQSMGFQEIQFDYMRFPDRVWAYDEDNIDYRNVYQESRAQAVQRFLMYACDQLHAVNTYVSADVFGECAEAYVTAYGQYWPAISGVADVICAMPYPDHYDASGSYLPWQHPYDTLYTFGTKAAQRQKETITPAAVRTWIQAYDAIQPPYNSYGATEVAQQIQALRDSGNTGGFMTWNAASSVEKYRAILPSLGAAG